MVLLDLALTKLEFSRYFLERGNMKLHKISVLTGLFLAACAPEVSKWTPAESPKKNIINRAVFTHTVDYPAHSESMKHEEKRALHQFLKRYILKPSSVNVTIDEYGGHSDKRIKDIERELVLFGISHHLIKIDSMRDSAHSHKSCGLKNERAGSGVELIFERYVVIPPSCSDFSQPIGNAAQEHNTSNFGCSDTANLGMMVANAKDLVDGRALDASDGPVIVAGIERYRTDAIKSLVDTSTTADPEQPTSGSTQSGGSSGASGAY